MCGMKKGANGRRVFLFLSYFFAILVVLLSLMSLFFSETVKNSIFSGNAIDTGYTCDVYSDIIPSDAKASSEYSAAYSAGKAIDNQGPTYWVSQGKNEQHWISFDLGVKKCVKKVTLLFNKDYTPMTVDVEVSDDRITWEKAYTDKAVPSGAISSFIEFAETDGRYVRILEKQTSLVAGPAGTTGSGTITQKYGTLTEIRVYAAARKAESTIVTNPGSGTPPDGATIDTAEQRCIDSDKNTASPDGKNLALKGTVDARPGGGALFEDKCVIQDGSQITYFESCAGDKCRIQEGFCTTTGALGTEIFMCRFGCGAGRCFTQATDIVKCTETDKNTAYPDGKNLALKGTTDARAGSGGLIEDKCALQETTGLVEVETCTGDKCRLKEGFCSTTGTANTEVVTCQYGCGAGRCLAQGAAVVKCTDSDKDSSNADGKNKFLKGSTDARSGGGILFEDRCIVQETSSQRNLADCSGSNCKLQEGFCSSTGVMTTENYTCENGCGLGRCLPSGARDINIDTEDEFDLSEERIINGYNVLIKEGNTYYIPYDDIFHFSKIVSVDNVKNQVTVYFDALLEDMVLKVGETENVDLDLDGKDDISLKLNKVTDGDNAEIHYALLKGDSIFSGRGNIGAGGNLNTGGGAGAGGNIGNGNTRGVAGAGGGGLLEKVNDTAQKGNLTDSKTKESKGFWNGLSENTQLVVIMVVLFLVLLTSLIVAYIITSKS